jgi:hypothetical protein
MQQIAALGKHAAQRAAAPLQAGPAVCPGQLHGEGHVRLGRLDAQLREELDQQRVGAAIEDQKAGVHAVRDALELEVQRIRMSAEMIAGLEQRDPRLARRRGKTVGSSQTCDAGANHGDAMHAISK